LLTPSKAPAPWAGGGAYKIPTEADIVVNATSIGLYPDIDGRLNLDVESLRPSLIVADVIPNPPRTRLIRDAEARGCRVLDGLGMIVNLECAPGRGQIGQ
jgi:shikimate dehydrogenase